YPVIGNLPVSAIDVALVMRVVQPIWEVRTETASRVRARVEAVLDWAAANGYRSGDNPARWRGHLDKLLPRRAKVSPVPPQPAMAFRDLPAFMGEVRQNSSISASALDFTILTASRTGEVIGAIWTEFDLEARIWTVPGNRMKSGRPHRVPLSDRCMV